METQDDFEEDMEEEIYDTFSANQFYDFGAVDESSDEENADGYFGHRESVVPGGKQLPSPLQGKALFQTSPPANFQMKSESRTPLTPSTTENIMEESGTTPIVKKTASIAVTTTAEETIVGDLGQGQEQVEVETVTTEDSKMEGNVTSEVLNKENEAADVTDKLPVDVSNLSSEQPEGAPNKPPGTPWESKAAKNTELKEERRVSIDSQSTPPGLSLHAVAKDEKQSAIDRGKITQSTDVGDISPLASKKLPDIPDSPEEVLSKVDNQEKKGAVMEVNDVKDISPLASKKLPDIPDSPEEVSSKVDNQDKKSAAMEIHDAVREVTDVKTSVIEVDDVEAFIAKRKKRHALLEEKKKKVGKEEAPREVEKKAKVTAPAKVNLNVARKKNASSVMKKAKTKSAKSTRFGPSPMRGSHDTCAAISYQSPTKRKRVDLSRGRAKNRGVSTGGGKRAKRSASPSYMRSTAASNSRDTASARLRNRRRSASCGIRDSSGKLMHHRGRARSREPKQKSKKSFTNKKLTMPKTPKLRSYNRGRVRSASREPLPSHTSRELMNIAARKRALDAQKPRHQRAYRAAMKGSKMKLQRSEKLLTIPATPKLTTAGLPRAQQAEEMRRAAIEMREAAAALKTAAMTGASLEMTETEPFQFASDARSNTEAASKGLPHQLPGPENPNRDMKTFGEKEFEISNQVPSRFHSVPQGEKPQLPHYEKNELTVPHSPSLATSGCSRPVLARSRSEQEEEYMSSIQPFKARPVSERIMLSSGDLGVPRVQKAAPTIPNPPKLRTASLASKNRKSSFLDRVAGKRTFKARGAPAHLQRSTSEILRKTKNDRASAPFKPTEAISPTLASASRANARKEMECKKREAAAVESQTFRALPVPDHVKNPAKRFKTKELGKSVLCEPQSPAFVAQHRARKREAQRRREEKALAELSSNQFKAAPIMDYAKESSRGISRHIEKRELTEPNFELSSDDRVAAAKEKIEALQREKDERLLARVNFRAREYRGPSKPFKAKKSNTPVTQPAAFKLRCSSRSASRLAFEKRQREREAAEKARQAILEAEKALKEKEEIRRIRKLSTFKALPMPRYNDGLSNCRSNAGVPRIKKRACTSPKSPNLSKSNRSKKKQYS